MKSNYNVLDHVLSIAEVVYVVEVVIIVGR